MAAWTLACAALGASQLAAQDLDPDQMRKAIDRGASYLKRQQGVDGRWKNYVAYDTTALCTLALLNAGVPVGDDGIRKALNVIRQGRERSTYCVALETMVLCAAEPQKDLALIRKNAEWLVSKHNTLGSARGMWSYPGGVGGFTGDNSNTQFALLALYEADRILERYEPDRPSPVPAKTWQLALDHWTSSQNNDGSWGYTAGARGTGSMTCAGITSIIICNARLRGGAAQVEGDQVRCCGETSEKNHVQKALQWLGRPDVWAVTHNPREDNGRHWLYYLYGLERVGRLTASRFIGKADWYRDGAQVLLSTQAHAGNWLGIGGAGEDSPEISTAFALLFLSKGRWPVLMSKVKYGKDEGGWNWHKGDVSNLTQYVEQRWRKDLTWQVIDSAAATADDYALAPVLFFSGDKPLDALVNDPVKVKELRGYLDRGGFILADACCDDPSGFDASFQELMHRVYPEPEFNRGTLTPITPDHEVWFIEEAAGPTYAGKLYGINVGCRTCVIYCRDLDEPLLPRPRGLSCFWELGRGGRSAELPPAVKARVDAAFALGINILAYATNRNPKTKDVVLGEQQRISRRAGTRQERWLTLVQKVRHGGGYNAAPGALPKIQREVEAYAGLLMPTDQKEVALNDEALFDSHMLFIHGRSAFSFKKEEREALRKFLERGGVIFGDAVCASEAFARSFREEMTAIFPDKEWKAIPADHAMFTRKYGGFDLATVKRRDPPRERGQGPLRATETDVPPELDGMQFENDRWGVIFSKYDLSCALESFEAVQCRGYTRDDAARIAINVVLYSLHE